jgi:outer membrane receptor protein involved in Fe transport
MMYSMCCFPAFLSIALPSLVGAQRADTVRADSAARARTLHTVTVVATPAERAAPVAATHLDAATVRAAPAATTYELLRQTAGVEVHQQGQGPGFASDASLRGFSSDHSTDLALWIDGVPVNEPVNGHAEGYGDWALLFPGGVQDIDVVRGPTSALFGNFALAGVVNVRTLERMQGSELSVSGGSYGRGDALFMSGFDHGADGGGVLGLRYQHDDGFRPRSTSDVVQGHGRLVRQFAGSATLDGGIELYGARWHSPGFLGEDEFAAGDYDIVSNPDDGGFKRRAQERLSLRVLQGATLWRTTAYATQGRWQLFLTIPPAGGRLEGTGSQTEEEDRRHGLGLTSALTWEGRRGEVTIGTEGRYDHADYGNYFTTSRQRDSVGTLLAARQLSGALFVQSRLRLAPRVRLDLGGRFDAIGTRSSPDGEPVTTGSYTAFSPKLGLLVRLTGDLGAYVNASRGFRSADGVIEDPSLDPILAWSYETGLKFDHAGTSLTATLFRVDVSDEQTFDPFTGASSNGGESRRKGLELGWRIPLGRVARVSGDWTFNDARYLHLSAVPEDGGAPEVLDGERVFNTSRFVGSAMLETQPGALPVRLQVSGNWIGRYSPFDEPGEETGGYGLLHAGASRTIGTLDVVAGIRNLLDRRYPELIAGHIVAPGQPRSLYLTLRRRW